MRRSAPILAYGQDTVEYTDAYTYRGVLFTGPKFTLRRAAETRLSRAYAALGGLERMCSQVQFQEPQTKLWLFENLGCFSYALWGSGLGTVCGSRQLEEYGEALGYYDFSDE